MNPPLEQRPRRAILLTGVTGFLGKVVLNELLDRTVGDIYVLVRSTKTESARARFEAKVLRSPAFRDRPRGWEERVHVVHGDVSLPQCGLAPEDLARLTPVVTEILHCAASIDFDLPLAEACESNTTSPLEVLEIARSCPALRVYVSVSTAYVTPHREGVIAEEVAPLMADPEATYASIRAGQADEAATLAASGHPNTYTFTKCLAEQLLVRRRGAVPLRIVRPSIISACVERPVPGWIDSRAALAAFVALVGAGYMRAVIASPKAELDVVPCDEVAARVVDAAIGEEAPTGLRVVHAVAGRGRGTPILGMARAVLDHFGRRPVLRKPHLAYVGPRGARYAYHRLVHHAIPAHAAALGCALRGDLRGSRRLLRGVARLDRTNALFSYFTQRTFDFVSTPRESAPPSREAYLKTVCEGIGSHLLPSPPAKSAAPSDGLPRAFLKRAFLPLLVLGGLYLLHVLVTRGLSPALAATAVTIVSMAVIAARERIIPYQ